MYNMFKLKFAWQIHVPFYFQRQEISRCPDESADQPETRGDWGKGEVGDKKDKY